MSTNISNYISKTLSIKDENITFLGNIYNKKINKLNTNIHAAVLSYKATFCPKCGNINHSDIIKHGFKDTLVRLSSINGEPTAIKLKNRDFYVNAVSLHLLQKLMLWINFTQFLKGLN